MIQAAKEYINVQFCHATGGKISRLPIWYFPISGKTGKEMRVAKGFATRIFAHLKK